MFHPASLFIGLRYAKLAKGNGFISFISFFSIAGITLGIIALVCVTSVMNGFENRLKSSMLSVIPHISVNLTNSEIDALSESNYINAAFPFIQSEGLAVSNSHLLAAAVFSVSGELKQPLYQYLSSAQINALLTQKYTVIITRRMALKLNVSRGDQIRLMLPSVTSYTPMGRMPSQRIFKVLDVIDNEHINEHIILTNLDSLLRLNRIKKDVFNQYAVFLTDPFNIETLFADFPELEKNKLSDWRDTQGALFSAVAMEKRIMGLLLGLIILVAGFNILSALTMMVTEKQSEIAILQTLGLPPQGVLQVFMVQGLFNGVVGSVLGVLGGLLIVPNINEVLTVLNIQLLPGMQLPVSIAFDQIAFIFFASIFMSFLATLYPARRAAALAPAQVLRYE